MNLALEVYIVYTFKWFLTCRKILRHGADAFIFLLKEGMLRILTALKNQTVPSAGVEPKNLCITDSFICVNFTDYMAGVTASVG
jgi:hypothetical protein